MKNLVIAICAALGLLVFSGCGKSEPRTPKQILNIPQTITEASALMQSLDRDAAEQNLTLPALKHIRRQMKGRLLSAGMREAEIEEWIESEPEING